MTALAQGGSMNSADSRLVHLSFQEELLKCLSLRGGLMTSLPERVQWPQSQVTLRKALLERQNNVSPLYFTHPFQ